MTTSPYSNHPMSVFNAFNKMMESQSPRRGTAGTLGTVGSACVSPALTNDSWSKSHFSGPGIVLAQPRTGKIWINMLWIGFDLYFHWQFCTEIFLKRRSFSGGRFVVRCCPWGCGLKQRLDLYFYERSQSLCFVFGETWWYRTVSIMWQWESGLWVKAVVEYLKELKWNKVNKELKQMMNENGMMPRDTLSFSLYIVFSLSFFTPFWCLN